MDAMEIGDRIFGASTPGENVDGAGEGQVKKRLTSFYFWRRQAIRRSVIVAFVQASGKLHSGSECDT